MKKLLFAFFLTFTVGITVVSCTTDEGSNSQMQNDDNSGDGNSGDDPTPLAAASFFNVSYGSHPQQVYDIYLPEGRSSTKTKVLVLVHGGGWVGGDKSEMDEFIDLIQENLPDHAIVNINYILAALPDTAAFPNQFLDVDKIIEQITAEKEELQVLPEFGLIGTSAGAHISLMYDYVYDTDDQVKMVCDIVGPSDFTDPFYANDPNFSLLFGLLVDEDAYPYGTNLPEATSPTFQVSGSSSPTIMFYGDQDPLVPLSNGQSLDAALSASKVDHNFTIYEGGHGDDWSPAALADLQAQLIAFINLHLGIQ